MQIASAGSLTAYGSIVVAWKYFGVDFNILYLTGGGLSVCLAIFCIFAYPRFHGPTVQRKTMVLRWRYSLYYALQFMAGARRQIFLVFAAFMMIEKFGFEVHEVTGLFLINYVANMIFAPIMGHVVGRLGERIALAIEYVGLVLIFMAYAGIYLFDWGIVFAASLYVLDHLFFALSIAQKTYFQKIADPADIAPTAAVAFTINHIGAVVLPALLGYVWLVSPSSVFGIAALMAFASLVLALCIPNNPVAGRETIFSRA